MTLPNLTKSRHGVYYLRLQRNGVDCRVSLATKNFSEAKKIALLFNLHIMNNPKIKRIDLEALREQVRRFDIKLPDGTEINNIHTREEVELVRQLIEENHPVLKIGMKDKYPSTLQAPIAKPLTKSYLELSELYLKEVSLKNTEKTIADKRAEFKNSRKFLGTFLLETFPRKVQFPSKIA